MPLASGLEFGMDELVESTLGFRFQGFGGGGERGAGGALEGTGG